LNSAPLFEPLSPDLLLKIKAEAFLVLNEVGVLMELEEAFGPLSHYGCDVVPKTGKVHFPPKILEKALSSAPSEIKMFDRSGNLVATLSDTNVHFNPGSAALNLLDFKTGSQRKPVLNDLLELAVLVNGLNNFALQSTALIPGEVPEQISDSIRLYAALKYCPKPVITGTFRRESFQVMKDMLVALRGGGEELRIKPLAIFDCCPSPPLRWSALTASALIDCASAGIPVELVSMPLMGATAPVTFVGALVQHCAENLSGVVLTQAIRPGAPVIYGGSPAVFDMRYGTTPMGAIETMLFNSAYAQIGRSFHLPTHTYMGLSDSRKVDYQGGFESGMGAIIAAASGFNVVSGAGMMDFESCQCFEKLVLDNEICGMALHLRQGIQPVSEILGFDLISRYADSGDFLKAPETRKFYRSQQYFPSAVVHRSAGNGDDDAYLRAHQLVEKLLLQPPPILPEPAKTRIQKLMSAEAKRFGLDNLSI
jgi:trimethylamine--corrinoid protein Co-methyltransferase